MPSLFSSFASFIDNVENNLPVYYLLFSVCVIKWSQRIVSKHQNNLINLYIIYKNKVNLAVLVQSFMSLDWNPTFFYNNISSCLYLVPHPWQNVFAVYQN